MDAVHNTLHDGFIKEARGYVKSLRDAFASNSETPDAALAIFNQFQILAGGARALGADDVAGHAGSAVEILDPVVKAGRAITPDEITQLARCLDDINTSLGPEAKDVAQQDVKTSASSGGDLLSDDLLVVFAQEAREHGETIQAGLSQIQANPGNEDAMRDVRRATHTLKGAAASVGIEPVAQLAHLMEDLLEPFIETAAPLSPEAVTLLVESGDTLDSLLASDSDHSNIELLNQLIGRYEQLPRPEFDALVLAGPDEMAPQIAHEDQVTLSPHEIESAIKVPLRQVDRLLNQVGEVAIGHSALEDQLKGFYNLLIELDYSSRRLYRLTRDIETQIDVVAQGQNDVIDTGDSHFDPLELDRYTSLYQLTRGLEEVAADTNNVNRGLQDLTQVFDASLTRERRLTAGIQEDLMTTRMVPFNTIEARLRRTVRQTARDLGKSVNFTLTGQDVLIDKTVLDALTEALMHLVRNSIDHGIETAEQRQTAGKPAAGALSLTIRRDRGRTILHLSDDGAGIDTSRVRERALALGRITADQELSDDRLIDLLFEEDFSLAEKLTRTSGRGIGLNIVRRAIKLLQGTIRVESAVGRGTTFILSLPVTLAVARTLTIRSCGDTFAVPLEQIAHVLRLSPEQLDGIRRQGMLRYEDRSYRIFDLTDFVNPDDRVAAEQRYGLLLDYGESATMVLVDGVMGIQDTVIKSLGPHLKRMHGLGGATIAGSGEVILILDLFEIVAGEADTPKYHTAPVSKDRYEHVPNLHVMVVDDSLSVRRAVCMTLEHEGWQTTTAKDGIEALERLLNIRPDVLLLDIEMPRMNGFELLARIRADSNLRGLPVIFLTSRASAKHRGRAEELGCDGYIVKPYRNEDLVDEVRRVAAVMPL